jgi:hypothetical protein
MLGFIKFPNRRRSTPRVRNLAPMARVLHASTGSTLALSHSRVPYTNISGRSCTSLEVFYTNWTYTAVNEFAGTSTATVRAAIEYPAGTITPLTTDGTNRDVVIAAGVSVSDALKASGLNIPAGAVFWIRTRCRASGGDGLMTRAYNNGSTYEGGTIQAWTGTDDGSDFTTSGNQPTISGAAFGPAAICSREFGNPKTSFALIGDSLVRGGSSGGVSYAEVAAIARGRTYLNVSFPGASVSTFSNYNMPRRRALLKATNCLDCLIGYPINDLSASRTNAQVQTDMIALWTALKGDGFGRIIQSTCSIRTITDINTPAPTPTGAFTGGASSFRAVHNTWLRTQAGLTNRPDFIYEFADTLELTRNSGTWKDTSVTTDFLHPTASAATASGNNLASYLATIGY